MCAEFRLYKHNISIYPLNYYSRKHECACACERERARVFRRGGFHQTPTCRCRSDRSHGAPKPTGRAADRHVRKTSNKSACEIPGTSILSHFWFITRIRQHIPAHTHTNTHTRWTGCLQIIQSLRWLSSAGGEIYDRHGDRGRSMRLTIYAVDCDLRLVGYAASVRFFGWRIIYIYINLCCYM